MADDGFRIEYGSRVEPPAEEMEGGGVVAVGTTAVELTFTASPIRSIIVTSSVDNTGIIYLGKSDVESDGSNAIAMVNAGEMIGIAYNDVTVAMYAVASVAAQSIVKGALY